MKSKLLKRIMALTIISTTLLTTIPTRALASWRQSANGLWWNTEGESWSIGWRFINGTWYHFGNDGYMKTGWVNDDSNWYYADSNGAMQTGIVQVDGKTYCLASSGAMLTGNINVNGKIYNFASSGEAIGDNVPQAIKAFSKEGITIKPIVVNKTKEDQLQNKTESSINSSSSSSSSSSSTTTSNNSTTGTSSNSSSSSSSSSIEETKLITDIHLEVPIAVIGNTPKNVKILKDDSYFVIVNEWNEQKIGSTSYRKMSASDKFKEGYKYCPTILLKAKKGYIFKNQWSWVTGRSIFINGKNDMPDFIDRLSQNTILQFRLHNYYEPIKADSSNINTDVELEENIDLSLDEIDSNNNEKKRYIQFVYKKDTLETTGSTTGRTTIDPNEAELFIEYNLKGWYIFNNQREYKLINDNGKVKLVKKYEEPVTVYYNGWTLDIRELKKGVYDISDITINEGEKIYKSDYGYIVIDAKDYGTTSEYMNNHIEDYKVVRSGSKVRLEKKSESDVLNNSNLPTGQTTPSAVNISIS